MLRDVLASLEFPGGRGPRSLSEVECTKISSKEGGRAAYIVRVEGRPTYFIKQFASSDDARREFDALSRSDLTPFQVPEPILIHENSIATSYVPGRPLSEMLVGLTANSVRATEQWPLIQRVTKDLALFHRSSEESNRTRINGDFSVSDILVSSFSPDGYWVVDWEDFDPSARPTRDLLNHLFMLGVFLFGSERPPAKIAEFLCCDEGYINLFCELQTLYTVADGREERNRFQVSSNDVDDYVNYQQVRISRQGRDPNLRFYPYLTSLFKQSPLSKRLVPAFSLAHKTQPAEVIYNWPVVGLSELNALRACLEESDLSGPEGAIHFLEQDVVDYLKVRYTLAHCNGTSAMFSAMFALGVGPGKEVICPGYTWWASISPCLWLGGQPVFCDIEPSSVRASIAEIVRLISDRTVAIIIPHLWGDVVDFERLIPLCRERKIGIIEDASHCFGSKTLNGFVGTRGDIGVFSLQARKPLSAGEGGLLVTNDKGIYERSCLVGHYERISIDHSEEAKRYIGTGLGLKFRMSPFCAAFARQQLQCLRLRLGRQDALVRCLAEELAKSSDVSLIGAEHLDRVQYGGRCGLRFLLTHELIDGLDLKSWIAWFRERGLPVSSDYHRPLQSAPIFSEKLHEIPSLPNTDDVVKRICSLSLPVDGSISAARNVGRELIAAIRQRRQ